MSLSSTEFYLTASLALCMERIAYGVVWKKPSIFSLCAAQYGFSGKEPEFIYVLVKLFKVIQLIVFLCWYFKYVGRDGFDISLPQGLFSSSLLIAGQILNLMVWKRIGLDGVCYGCKFGRNVPWCTKFPFSLFNHPQYLGVILTVWGVFFLFYKQCPNDWFILPLVETGLTF
eukprot:snap_masked-scaffold_17-processed-gene-5.23-mRNA-1 protein AED:0.30 eAED:0.30 QI:0/0/0/0.5/1/1/2/0/171